MRVYRSWLAVIVSCLVSITLSGCQEQEEPLNVQYEVSEPVLKQVTPLIAESSGIADSRRNPGYLWVQEDGSNPTQLYLLGHDGKTAKTVFIKGAQNRDWEDMALVNGNLYIADIGDNNAAFEENVIYTFPEPAATTDTIYTFDKIRYKYPDGAHDAEAFLVDPGTNDIYIITKRDSASQVYKLSYPYNLNATNVVKLVSSLNYNNVVSAALSEEAGGIILKTYTSLIYYKRNGNQPIESALKNTPVKLPYVLEPQGEAVTFTANGKGYFTLSEKGFATDQRLYYYKLN